METCFQGSKSLIGSKSNLGFFDREKWRGSLSTFSNALLDARAANANLRTFDPLTAADRITFTRFTPMGGDKRKSNFFWRESHIEFKSFAPKN